MGGLLRGIFDPENDRFIPYEKPGTEKGGPDSEPESLTGERIADYLGTDELRKFRDEMELAREGSSAFDIEQYRAGHMTPVYFGSALRKLGVRELLDAVAAYAPPPRAQPSTSRVVEPAEPKVTGFVFKVQANMDANHRDRIAMSCASVSGRFQRGMRLKVPEHRQTVHRRQQRDHVLRAATASCWTTPGLATLSASRTTVRSAVGDTLSEEADLIASPACRISRPKSCAASASTIR